MLLALPALAADLLASGGADLVGGVVHAADVWSGQATGQVEGALSVKAGAVELGAEIDARFGLAPTVLFALVPERLDIGGRHETDASKVIIITTRRVRNGALEGGPTAVEPPV